MQSLQFPPYALVLLCSAALNIGLGIYAINKKHDKDYFYFGLAFIVAGAWPLLYAIELMQADPAVSLAMAKYRAVPAQFFPIFLVTMIHQLIKHRMPPRWLTMLLISFAFFQVFIMVTSDSLFPIWDKSYVITTREGFTMSVMVPGLWFKFGSVLYHYSSNIIVLHMLFKAMQDAKTPFRKQYSLLITSILVTFIVAILYTYNIVSFGIYNPIPASFIFSTFLFALAIFKYRLLSIAPYAKESVFDIIQSPVLITDENDLLVDYNPQAKAMLRVGNDMIGVDIAYIFRTINMDWEKLKREGSITFETKWGTGNNYKFSTLLKEIEKDNMKGKIIVFSDITVQLDAMKTIHEHEIVTYKESILGDMHDGIGGVVATGTILAQSALEDDDIEEKNKKISQIASLLENGSFELRSMLNILDKDSISWQTLTYDMRSYSSTVLDSKGISRQFDIKGKPFETDIDFDRYLSIFRLFKETITNVIKHSHAANVVISIEFIDNNFKLTISDDGIGIKNVESGGFGLKNMQNRAGKLNGTVDIKSNNGTTVNIIIKI